MDVVINRIDMDNSGIPQYLLKAEIETHGEPGALSIYVHYGQSRPIDAKILAQSNVVLTTYGVVASEFSSENVEERGGLYSVRWFRVVLDEAHTIKSSKSQISMAAATLVANRRWCLTGTPIQVIICSLCDLLHIFLACYFCYRTVWRI